MRQKWKENHEMTHIPTKKNSRPSPFAFYFCWSRFIAHEMI